jgi:RNA polymerase sigma-70 factor (ECF subfamily)
MPSAFRYTRPSAASRLQLVAGRPGLLPKPAISGVMVNDCGTKSVTTPAEPPERERHWAELMDQSLDGNAESYQRLLVLLTVAVRNAVRSRVRFAGLDAEDVVQEVLLALHLKRSTWMRGTPVGPWVAAIARNKIVDALRRRGRRTEVPIESVLETLGVEEVSGQEQAHDLERALAKLNPRQREVVRAVSLEGHTAQEAAARLQMSEGAVRVMLHRSLKVLAGHVQWGAR